MTLLETIEQQLQAAHGQIAQARHHLRNEQSVDLTDLDKNVQQVCDSIVQLPTDQRDRFKTPMIALVDDLNSLITSLQAQQAEMQKALQASSQHSKAARAYGHKQADTDSA